MPEMQNGQAPAAQRPLLHILNKYEPGPRARDLLESARDYTVRADKEKRMLEISAHFPSPIEKRELYQLEEEIRAAYDLAMVKFLPHYPSHFWGQSYIPELLAETERVGIVARGFFSHYKATLTGDELTVELPFEIDGIRLMENGHTPEVMQRIVYSEFGLEIKVHIRHNLQIRNRH